MLLMGLGYLWAQWSHETEELARDQFTHAVDAALDAHGLTLIAR